MCGLKRKKAAKGGKKKYGLFSKYCCLLYIKYNNKQKMSIANIAVFCKILEMFANNAIFSKVLRLFYKYLKILADNLCKNCC